MTTLLAIIGWLISNPTVLAIAAGALGMFGWGWKQRRAGAAAVRAEQAAAEQKARDVRDQVDNDMGTLTPAQRREELRKWSKS